MYRVVLLLCAVLIVGCASSSNEIHPQYVSHLQYQSHSCSQIGARPSAFPDASPRFQEHRTGRRLQTPWRRALLSLSSGQRPSSSRATALRLPSLVASKASSRRLSKRQSRRGADCGSSVRLPTRPRMQRPEGEGPQRRPVRRSRAAIPAAHAVSTSRPNSYATAILHGAAGVIVSVSSQVQPLNSAAHRCLFLWTVQVTLARSTNWALC